MKPRELLAAAAAALACALPVAAARAATPATPATPADHTPTLTLQAAARAEVPNDEMRVVLAVEREGPTPAGLNDAVLRSLREALDEARAVAGVDARLGSVFTSQVFGAQGKPTGWRVHGEVVLVSRRMAELGQLAGNLAQRLMLVSVGYSVSRERRDAEERRLLDEAARAFRDKAQASAAAFGFKGYALRDLTIDSGSPPAGPRMYSMAARAGAAAAPVPTEGGDTEVSVVVNGRIALE